MPDIHIPSVWDILANKSGSPTDVPTDGPAGGDILGASKAPSLTDAGAGHEALSVEDSSEGIEEVEDDSSDALNDAQNAMVKKKKLARAVDAESLKAELLKSVRLEIAHREHLEFQSHLIKKMREGAINTSMAGAAVGGGLGALDYFERTELLDSSFVSLLLFLLSVSIVKGANTDLLAVIRKEQARKPQTAHKLGDVEVHRVLGESMDQAPQKPSKEPEKDSRRADLMARAKMMAVFAKVIARYPPEEQAIYLGIASVLMACAVPLTISGLSRLEYIGEVMEARAFDEGLLNRSFQKAKRLSPRWHLLAQEITCHTSELVGLTLRFADLFSLEAAIIAAGAVIAPVSALVLSAASLPDINIDANVGLRIGKAARGVFRFLPEAIIFGKYATGGRVFDDGIEALGNFTEHFGESIKQIPFIGVVADFGKRMVLWALTGGAIGAYLFGIDKGVEVSRPVMVKYRVMQKAEKLFQFACAGAVCTGLTLKPPNTEPICRAALSWSPKRDIPAAIVVA